MDKLQVTMGISDSCTHSMLGLRDAAEGYEKHATQRQWDELLVARADVAELGQIAAAANERKGNKKSPTGMEKFCTVALEYSKLLDVVMNQCPEYASLAWGVTKLLLVANINHSRLKENVERYLISIGEQSALVNQFIIYNPTEKMAETVGLLYADFSKFLEKAIRYYAKSKLSTVLSAFTFPWETKFVIIIDRINLHFQRIKDLCNASHFGTSLQNNHLLHTIWNGHQEVHQAILKGRRDEQLRQEIQEDIVKDIYSMLQSFDTKWLGKFDQLVQQQTVLAKSASDLNINKSLLTVKSEDFLSNMVGSEQSLLEFRTRLYPGLDHFHQWEDDQRARGRNMTTYDYQHCAKLLGHPEMKAWMEKDASAMIWINSHQITKAVDWVSFLTTKLVDHSAQLKYVTVLRQFCLRSYSDKVGSSPCILLQSLIFQALFRHRTQFLNNRSGGLAIQRFEGARQDIEQLWDILLEIIKTAKMNCIWIVIDRIDILPSYSTNEEVLALLNLLENLLQDSSVTVKILITARIGGSHLLSRLAGESGVISANHPIINVPRGYHRHEPTLLARYSKKPHRLQEPRQSKVVGNNQSKISNKSFDDSSDGSLDSKQQKVNRVGKRSSAESLRKRLVKSTVEDSESTCSLDNDILLSSPETTSSESANRRRDRQNPKIPSYSSSENSSDDNLTMAVKARGVKPCVNGAWDSESSDDHLRIGSATVSPETPTFTIALHPEECKQSQGLKNDQGNAREPIDVAMKHLSFDSDEGSSDS
ncbi:MAG: hypothetical protein Q9167_002227 [Letrouitia subvulpina]